MPTPFRPTRVLGAVGCNLAWGIIDGVFYLMGVLAERGSHLTTYRALRQAADPREADGLIAAALPRERPGRPHDRAGRMMPTRFATTLLVLVLCCASPMSAQTAASPTQAATPETPADPAAEGAKEWAFSAVLSIYQVPDDRIYGQPTVMADRDRLHLEARFNYEDINTGSAWVGYNLGGGEKVTWELTPLFGVVFGNVSAVAPGYRGSVSWWRLDFSSEGEYVFGDKDAEERFFYNWSELTVAPADWWRIGLVTQRTRAYAADRDVQRGLLAGFSHGNIDSAIYLLNPDDGAPIVVAAVTLAF